MEIAMLSRQNAIDLIFNSCNNKAKLQIGKAVLFMEAVLENYSNYLSFAQKCRFGRVYPFSIAMGLQQGDIFVNSKNNCRTVLFWHKCGFAHISGGYDEAFLDSLYDIILDKKGMNPRRFLLFADSRTAEFYKNKENIEIERRYFFEYADNCNCAECILPNNCEIKEIDTEILSEINGRITPYFSWSDSKEFLSNGKGFCLFEKGIAAAWAFSSAVSDEEIDIGVETDVRFQHKGYASVVSRSMVNYVLSENKTPLWACHYQNTGSIKLAEKLGFKKTEECTVVRRG